MRCVCFRYNNNAENGVPHYYRAAAMLAVLVAAVPSTVGRLTVVEHALHGLHRPPPGMPHPEVPARLDAAAAALRRAPFADRLNWVRTEQLNRTPDEVIAAMGRVHSEAHLAIIQATAARGGGGFDADTFCAPGSWKAMIDGTSAWLEAASLAARGEGPALALARPPGHHATRDTPMGFCLINFAAVAAADYLAAYPSGRVAILDWDVHHGNGVAAIVADEPRVRYCSTHERGGFPRTGLDEVRKWAEAWCGGAGRQLPADGLGFTRGHSTAGGSVRYSFLAEPPPAVTRARPAAPVQADHGLLGNILHLPLPAGSGSYTYLKRLREEAIPFLLGHREGDDWAPDFLIICAGAPVDVLKC